jgi:hypothetical protein
LLELADTGVGEVAARRERNCSACTPAQAGAALTETVGGLVIEAESRPRGTLIVHSTPPSAEVRAGDRLLGRTPYEGPAWAGELNLSIKLKGYDSQDQRVLIFDRRTETLDVKLVSELPEPAPAALLVQPWHYERLARPRWRFVLGGVLLGGALLMFGFGGSALANAKGCTAGPNGQQGVCQPAGVGAALLGSGAFLSATGGLLFGIPGPFHRVDGEAVGRP